MVIAFDALMLIFSGFDHLYDRADFAVSFPKSSSAA
jgi:hypothetical protein